MSVEPPDARPLPAGLVTFAFVDVVGSTRAFVEHGDAFVEALAELHQRIAAAAARRGGVVVSTEGDGAFLAFADAVSAVEAVSALQEELAATPTTPLDLRLRAGAHTGNAMPVGDNYVALAVNVAARVTGAANAGQLLVTDAVVEALVAAAWYDAGRARDTGTYALKDLAEPLRLWHLAGDETPPRATPARRTNVQQSRTSFVGRGEELDVLRTLVGQPGHVTVVGPGGVGKTRLVSELALADAEAFPGGAWLVELATLDSPDQVVGALGASLGVSTRADTEVAAELARRGRCLFVLDNCEHLVDTVADVVDRLVGKCPELTVLCTSREPLQLPGERVWTLAPLSPSDGAVTLFLDRVGDRDLDPDQVQALCEALDGLPLAVELAAGHAHSAHLADLVEAVASGSDAFPRRGGEPRQRSLDAILDWSLARLSKRWLDALLVLSVFPGRFSPAMARGLLGAVPRCDPLAARPLAARSLVDLDGDDYRLLATIRAAARRRLAADPPLEQQALDALASWAAAYGAERYAILTYHDDVPPDTLLAVEAGLTHGVDSGRTGLGRAWHLVSVTAAVRGVSAATLAAADRMLQREWSRHEADDLLALAAAGSLHAVCGGQGISEAQAEAAIAAARATNDPHLLERVLSAVAAGEERRGDGTRGLAHRLEAMRLAETHPEVAHQLPAALNNLGNSYSKQEDFDRARTYYERAVVAAERAGFDASVAIAQVNLTDIALSEERWGEAVTHALTALRSAPPRWRLRGFALGQLAQAHAALGQREAAVAAAREALPLVLPMASRDPIVQEQADFLLAVVADAPPR